MIFCVGVLSNSMIRIPVSGVSVTSITVMILDSRKVELSRMLDITFLNQDAGQCSVNAEPKGEVDRTV